MAITSKVPPRLITALLYLCFITPTGIVIAVIKGHIWFHWQPIAVILLLVEAIGIGTFFALAIQLSQRVDATQFVIISNISTIIAVLLGKFVIHDVFRSKQFAGMFLLLVGSLLIAAKGIKRRTWQFDNYSLLLMGASVSLGIGLAAERACLNYMSYSAYLIVGWSLQSLFACVFACHDWHVLPKITKKQWQGISKLGVARAMQGVGFFLAVVLSRNVALVVSASSFRVPLIFLASYLFLHERDYMIRRIAGTTIATLGLLLL